MVSGSVLDPGPGADGVDRSAVDVVVPLKRLDQAKSRLAGASAGSRAHRELVLALLRDTLAAARAARRVRRLVVVTAEEHLARECAADGPGPEIVQDPGGGLNAALRAAAAHLAAPGPGGSRRAVAAVAALQADLPALRAAELDDALAVALALVAAPAPTAPPSAATAAFVADRQRTGTTLLVTAPDRVPDPRFGPGSAGAHAAAGAVALDGAWPGLRADVDTPADLARARTLGCGPATSAWLGRVPVSLGEGGRCG